MTENFDRLRKLAGIKPKQILKESAVVETTTEYDIGKPTDTFGQFKAKPMEPDFPVDMGEVFSSGSSDSSEGETLAGMDGAGEDHSEVSQPAGEETSTPKTTEPKASSEPKDDYSDYFKSDAKEEPEAEEEEVADEPKEEPKDDEDFDKKKVAEARRFYQLKRLVHRNIAEGTTDFGAAFMAGMQAFDRISDKLIVEHNINLTSEQEHKIAKAVAVELAYGKSTLESIAESHSVEGRKQGPNVVFEFADKAMAMIFLNEINESGNCIGRLRYNRGFVEAVVKSFE